MIPLDALRKLPPATLDTLTPFVRGSFSRYGEDLVLFELGQRLAGFPERGFYVDVGAHHPLRCSNTVALYLRGWRGLNIDAHIDAVRRLRAMRERDVTVHAGVAGECGTMTFHHVGIGAGSSFDPAHVERMKALGKRVHRTVEVPCDTLDALLEEHLPEGQAIHYLDIDVEGLDEVVVASLDTERWAPWVISVETFTEDLRELIDQPIVRSLEERGYALSAVVGRTSFFLRRERIRPQASRRRVRGS